MFSNRKTTNLWKQCLAKFTSPPPSKCWGIRSDKTDFLEIGNEYAAGQTLLTFFSKITFWHDILCCTQPFII